MKNWFNNVWRDFCNLPLSIRLSWIMVSVLVSILLVLFPVFVVVILFSSVAVLSVLNIIDWQIDRNRRYEYYRSKKE